MGTGWEAMGLLHEAKHMAERESLTLVTTMGRRPYTDVLAAGMQSSIAPTLKPTQDPSGPGNVGQTGDGQPHRSLPTSQYHDHVRQERNLHTHVTLLGGVTEHDLVSVQNSTTCSFIQHATVPSPLQTE